MPITFEANENHHLKAVYLHEDACYYKVTKTDSVDLKTLGNISVLIFILTIRYRKVKS